MFWPEDLSEQAAKLSIIPKLLETQDDFIAILSVRVRDIEGIFEILKSAELPANMFLKHLAILADVGGEPLQRITREFNRLFPDRQLKYSWGNEERIYHFRYLPAGVIGNEKLNIAGKQLFDPHPLTPLYEDVITLLLLGSNAIFSEDQQMIDILTKCEISNYLGKPDELERFIRQRYLWVSRITGGAQANTLGQITQTFIREYLEKHLGMADVDITGPGRIPGITQTQADDQRLINFDLVASNGEKYVAIEISFQVTTNSTIERKSGQALSRFEQLEAHGHKIAYVIDGAGNFQRESALRTICAHSHCTVALSKPELDILCQFLREYFGSE